MLPFAGIFYITKASTYMNRLAFFACNWEGFVEIRAIFLRINEISNPLWVSCMAHKNTHLIFRVGSSLSRQINENCAPKTGKFPVAQACVSICRNCVRCPNQVSTSSFLADGVDSDRLNFSSCRFDYILQIPLLQVGVHCRWQILPVRKLNWILRANFKAISIVYWWMVG